eukprot:3772378-Rhodomonas_salina.1
MGHRMTEGEDYIKAFALVPHSTSARVIISLAAALDLEPRRQGEWPDLYHSPKGLGGAGGRCLRVPTSAVRHT